MCQIGIIGKRVGTWGYGVVAVHDSYLNSYKIQTHFFPCPSISERILSYTLVSSGVDRGLPNVNIKIIVTSCPE